jgi:hypothetical protein
LRHRSIPSILASEAISGNQGNGSSLAEIRAGENAARTCSSAATSADLDQSIEPSRFRPRLLRRRPMDTRRRAQHLPPPSWPDQDFLRRDESCANVTNVSPVEKPE